VFSVKNTPQLRQLQEVTLEEHAEGVVDLSPGWSEAEPWVLNVNMRPAQSGRGQRARVVECWDKPPGCSVCYVTLNLTPIRAIPFFGMLYPGLKRGLRPLAPSGQIAFSRRATIDQNILFLRGFSSEKLCFPDQSSSCSFAVKGPPSNPRQTQIPSDLCVLCASVVNPLRSSVLASEMLGHWSFRCSRGQKGGRTEGAGVVSVGAGFGFAECRDLLGAFWS
jgi:hypothetical protein